MNISKSMVIFMALITGVIVANLYYVQPLIPLIAHDFGVSEQAAGSLAYLTQGGYAIGVFVLIPLGDMLERKRQILYTSLLASICLLLMAVVTNFTVLKVVSFALGFTSVVPQLVLPMAATLASDKQRGQVIGTIVSGLLIGILLSRTLSGFVGLWLGYRAMFLIAFVISLVLAILIVRILPKNKAQYPDKWTSLYSSLYTLIKSQPILREASLISALAFAQFGAFWTTMVLLLHNAPFNYDTAIIGSFGIIGAVGAFSAPLIGKFGGQGQAKKLIFYGIIMTLISFVVFYFSSQSLFGIIIGVILIDLGLQTTHVSNQTRIYSLLPQARNRLNTVYMSFSFLGTAFGSAFGLSLYAYFGWSGVCIGCITLSLLSALVFFMARKNKQ